MSATHRVLYIRLFLPALLILVTFCIYVMFTPRDQRLQDIEGLPNLRHEIIVLSAQEAARCVGRPHKEACEVLQNEEFAKIGNVQTTIRTLGAYEHGSNMLGGRCWAPGRLPWQIKLFLFGGVPPTCSEQAAELVRRAEKILEDVRLGLLYRN